MLLAHPIVLYDVYIVDILFVSGMNVYDQCLNLIPLPVYIYIVIASVTSNLTCNTTAHVAGILSSTDEDIWVYR